MKKSWGSKMADMGIYLLVGGLALLCIYPFIYVLSASISSSQSVIRGDVLLFPKDITFEAYTRVLTEPGIWIAYGNTIYYTVVGTAFSLFVTICGAYPLSKRRLKGRSAIAFFIAFTMWFNAGIIPTYLNLKDLGLLDTRTEIGRAHV